MEKITFLSKRNFLFFGIILMMVFLSFIIYASEDHSKSVKDVLREIREEQNIKKNSEIDAGRVSDRLLEELGEALMSAYFPNEKQHEWMDQMMGGEDSQSLKAMHQVMGYNYLTGGYNNNGYYWNMPMMRGGPMMWNGYGRGMMNYFGRNFWFGGIIMWVIFLLIIGGIIFLIFYALKRSNAIAGKKEETPLDILKKKYVNGEISKEEFESKKKDIS